MFTILKFIVAWATLIGMAIHPSEQEMGFIDDAANGMDLEYLKIGNTIYTQDSDKQGWTGREVE